MPLLVKLNHASGDEGGTLLMPSTSTMLDQFGPMRLRVEKTVNRQKKQEKIKNSNLHFIIFNLLSFNKNKTHLF